MKKDKDSIIQKLTNEQRTTVKEVSWLVSILPRIPFIIMTITLHSPTEAYDYVLDNLS